MIKLYNGVDLDAARYRIAEDQRDPTRPLNLLEYLLDTVPDLLVALEVMGGQLELARQALYENMQWDEQSDGQCRYCMERVTIHADDCLLRRVFAINPDGSPTVPADVPVTVPRD